MDLMSANVIILFQNSLWKAIKSNDILYHFNARKSHATFSLLSLLYLLENECITKLSLTLKPSVKELGLNTYFFTVTCIYCHQNNLIHPA